MRPFELVRTEDVTGVSGTGVVAEGIIFKDGQVAMRWCTEDGDGTAGGLNSTVIHENINNVIEIHGHEGRTKVKFVQLNR
jgi:hypothetical protein